MRCCEVVRILRTPTDVLIRIGQIEVMKMTKIADG